jgi:hypothetical protein
VRLDGFRPGTVRDVSPTLGTWLVAERYAEPEMRRSVNDAMEHSSDVKDWTTQAPDQSHPNQPRRRSDD